MPVAKCGKPQTNFVHVFMMTFVLEIQFIQIRKWEMSKTANKYLRFSEEVFKHLGYLFEGHFIVPFILIVSLFLDYHIDTSVWKKVFSSYIKVKYFLDRNFFNRNMNEVTSLSRSDLSESSGQIAIFVAFLIALDVIFTIFAFGFIQTQQRKQYKRLGIPPPYFSQGTPLRTLSRSVFRRRPSPLAQRVTQKLRPKSYYINGHKSFFKRAGTEQEHFEPEVNIDYNQYDDEHIQQRLGVFFL